MNSIAAFTQNNDSSNYTKQDSFIGDQDKNLDVIKIPIKKSMAAAGSKDSGEVVFYMHSNLCKGRYAYAYFIPSPQGYKSIADTPKTYLKVPKPKLIIITGTVSYDFFYRSRIDTPIAQSDLQQHTERINLNVSIKEKYPIKVSLIARQSNSPYFKNFIDMNYQFDRFAYNKKLKQSLINKLNGQIPSKPELTIAENTFKEKLNRYEALKNWLNSPATLQKIIEERERKYNQQLKQSINSKENKKNDSALQPINKLFVSDSLSIQSNTEGKGEQSIAETNYDSLFAGQNTTAGLRKLTLPLNSIENKLDSTDLLKKLSNVKQPSINDSSTGKLKNVGKAKSFLQKILSTNPQSIQDSLSRKLDVLKDSTSNKAVKLENQSSLKDSLTSKSTDFTALYNQRKEEFKQLADSVKKWQRKTDSLKNILQKDLTATKQKVYQANSERELKKLAAENNIALSPKEKMEKVLSGIKTLGIGRSILNYTELTAQNITVTGINIEYNTSFYAAFTAGKIDYRFRDFFNKNTSHNNQYLLMGRVGIGDIERKAIILSVFQGRKSSAQSGFSDSVNSSVNIMGYAIEALYKKDENTSMSVEFAKSTIPASGSLQENKQLNALWKFADKRNMGINIKAQTIIPETNTKLSGFFRKTGEAFQSFSLFSYNTDQTAWLVRADQSFIRNRIVVTGMLRQNDFTNPFTDKTFKTSTTFKSVLLNIRFPKYPSLSIGYYPASQLYFINKEKIRENAYYILNSSLVYSYFYKGIGMNSSVLYNQYFNQATDSGFVQYKGLNYYASQTIFLKKLQLKAGFAYTKQPELKFYTLESSADYTMKKFLRIGAGIKYNKIFTGSSYIGERVLLSADFNHWGGIQFQYEKTFLPTFNNTLAPVDLGRISLYKNF